MNRRDYLKASGLLGASVLAGCATPASPDDVSFEVVSMDLPQITYDIVLDEYADKQKVEVYATLYDDDTKVSERQNRTVFVRDAKRQRESLRFLDEPEIYTADRVKLEAHA